MSDETVPVSRRQYLRSTAGAAVGVAGLAGCMGGGGTGTLATQVTDQPGDIADFESCVVTIVGLWVKPAEATATSTATGTSSGNAGRVRVDFEQPRKADLVKLQNGKTKLVNETELETGEYEFLQLDVDGVDATLKDGGDATVKTPGGAPLKFNQSFEIRANATTTFTADFTPVQQGQTNNYVLQPVASGTSVEYSTESQ